MNKLPQYGRFRFGKQHKYGRYQTTTDDGFSIGPHVVYRIRKQSTNEMDYDFTQMTQEKFHVSTGENSIFRVRINQGEWIQNINKVIAKDVYKIRIRSISKDNTPSPWVHGDRLEIKENKE